MGEGGVVFPIWHDFIALATIMVIAASVWETTVDATDTNPFYDPCSDAKVQKWDGFTFGLAFSSKDSFYQNQIQFSPCDQRLGLATSKAQLAVFRPKVDEISLLTVNGSVAMSGGFMVAFAGRKYAARSQPIQVADDSHTMTSFTLVIEFQKGTLINLYWKKFGCDSCTGDSVCVGSQGCAVPNNKCARPGSCNIGIQLIFSGTDRYDAVLNSWYEVNNLRRHSLYSLYGLLDQVASPFVGT